MIECGTSLTIVALCPDCQNRMQVVRRYSYDSLGAKTEGDFSSVYCQTEDCISRGFTATIEKKSGIVIFTDARYIYDHENDNWKPIYRQFVDKQGNVIK